MDVRKIHFRDRYLITTDELGRKARYSLTPTVRIAPGTPINAVAAEFTTIFADDNNLKFTAITKGVSGDDITVEYVAPNRDGASLEVVEGETDIVVNLEGDTDGVVAAAEIGAADSEIQIEAVDGGSYANEYTVEVVNGVGIDSPLKAVFEDGVITVTLATDASGDPDDVANDADFVTAVIHALPEFTAVRTGNNNAAVPETVVEFADGEDPTILTIASDIITELAASKLVTVAGVGEVSGVVEALEETHLDGGVDGTVATRGKIYFDEDFIYLALEDNTVAETNWVKFPIAVPDDETIEIDSGVLKVKDGGISLAKLDVNTGIASLVAAGLGASASFVHDDGFSPLTILAANETAEGDRAVLIMVICNEALGGDTPAEAEIGETLATDKFFDLVTLTAMGAGDVLCTGGVLTEECDLLATYTDGAGSNGDEPTGEFTVIVLALPVAS